MKLMFGTEMLENYKGNLAITAENTAVTVTNSAGEEVKTGNRVLPIGRYLISAQSPTDEYQLIALSLNNTSIKNNSYFDVSWNTDINIYAKSEILRYTSASLFTFNGDTITGYNGPDSDIIFPTSYNREAIPNDEPGMKVNKSYYSMVASAAWNYTAAAEFCNKDKSKVITYTNYTEFGNFTVDFAEDEEVFMLSLDTTSSTAIYRWLQQFSSAYGFCTYPLKVTINSKTYMFDTYEAFTQSSVMNMYGTFLFEAADKYIYSDGTDFEVTKIGTNAFSGNTDLTSVKFLGNIQSIANGAFNGCTSLSKVIFSTVDEIFNITYQGLTSSPFGTNGFGSIEIDNQKITSIRVPDSIININAYALYGADINEVILSDSVESIGTYAFSRSSIQDIDLKNIKTISSYAFQYCANLSAIDLPATLTRIDSSAFQRSGLTEVDVPDSVTTLGSYAFDNCSNLRRASVGNGVLGLSTYVFQNCTSLEDLRVYGASGTIGAYALYNCPSLMKLFIYSQSPWIVSDIFTSIDLAPISENSAIGAKIYVPDTLLDTYQTSSTYKWSNHGTLRSNLTPLCSVGTLNIGVSNANITVIDLDTQETLQDGDQISMLHRYQVQSTYTLESNRMLSVDKQSINSGDSFRYDGAIDHVDVRAYSGDLVFNYKFGENTPEQINVISNYILDNNISADYIDRVFGWEPGDSINISMSVYGTIPYRIIGVNHDTISGTSRKAPFTLETAVAISHVISDGHSGKNYVASRNHTNMPQLEARLPAAWSGMIREVDKEYRSDWATDTNLVTTSPMRLFLLSVTEYFNSLNEGAQYKYYADGNTARKYMYTEDPSTYDAYGVHYFTRTLTRYSSSSSLTEVYLVRDSGALWSNSGGGLGDEISVAFCI